MAKEDAEIQKMPPGLELARAYVPFQRYQTSLPPEEGLRAGTIFQELIRPYAGRGDPYSRRR
jgi:hypothetical protein